MNGQCSQYQKECTSVLRGSSALTLPKELNNFFFVTKIIRKERDTDKEREIDREKET